MTREELLAAIPDREARPEPRVPKSKAARLADILVGAVEAPLSVGSSMATFPAAVLLGAGNDERFRRFMEAGTYVPRSEAGREALEIIGKGVEKAKVPPYVPVVRGMGAGFHKVPGAATVLEGRAAGGTPPGKLLSQVGAIKPAPGGHWTPSSQQRLAALLTGGDGPEGLDFAAGAAERPGYRGWAEKAAARWLSKHAGTDRDPARALNLGTQAEPATLEQLVDKSLKKRRVEQLDPAERPAMARAAEEVWDFNPALRGRESRLAAFLSHVGDFARGVEPADLERMDLPTLLRKVHEADRRQLVTTGKKLGARDEAVARIAREHPGGPLIRNPQGDWYEFKGGMDPEKVKLGLSVDTCVGEHCIAQAAHGRPQWGYPGYVPIRDIVSGRPMRELHPEASLPDTTQYINAILRNEAAAYSLRDPQGQPLATSYVGSRAPGGVQRDVMRRQILTPREYAKWQGSQREAGVPAEQRVQLPGQQARVVGAGPGGEAVAAEVAAGRGHMVPPRGLLGPEHLESIMRMFPQYRPAIEALAIKRIRQLEQVKGRKNMGVPPEFAPRLAELVGKADLASGDAGVSGTGQGDLMRSGVAMVGGKPVTVQELLASEGQGVIDALGRTAGMGLGVDVARRTGVKALTHEETAALGELVRALKEAR